MQARMDTQTLEKFLLHCKSLNDTDKIKSEIHAFTVKYGIKLIHHKIPIRTTIIML